MDDSANSSDIELSPSITQEIQQLADSLKQTNENLYTFQFMLNQYKKLARVAPIQNTVKNDCIEKELKQISHSIKQLESKDYSSNFQELKDHLSQPQNSINDLDICQLKDVISELKDKLTTQDNRCVTLTEVNVRLTHELAAEKERNMILDQKLDAEKKAAQVVGRDIQNYVDYVKKLETQIKFYKDGDNNKHLSSNPARKISTIDLNDSSSSVLCQTCIIDEDENDCTNSMTKNSLQTVVNKVQLIAEHIESQNENLVEELRNSRIRDQPPPILNTCSNENHQSDSKINLQKLELAEVLAEKNSLHVINEKLTHEVEKLRSDIDKRESKYQNLKSKCRILLNKYRSKGGIEVKSSEKIKTAKRVLMDLQKLFIAKDKNHLILMNYFGSQIEIFGRILSAFAGDKYNGPVLGVEAHKKLTVWFTALHSTSIWCQKEILSLGKRQWTENDEFYLVKSAAPKPDCDTLSEISTNLSGAEERLPKEVIKALQSQVAVFQQTDESVKLLGDVLGVEN